MKYIKLYEEYVLKQLEDQYDIILDLWEGKEHLELSKIEVPKEARGSGVGSNVMQTICDYADEVGKKIYLTPSKDFGATSIARLESFYKDFGFVKKPKDDFSVRHVMVRFPETNEAKKSKPKSFVQKVKDMGKKVKKLTSKGRDEVDKLKDLQDKQKEGGAEPSDKLTAALIKTNTQIARVDIEKTSLKKQQLELKKKIKTTKDSEKAKKQVADKSKEMKKESFLFEKRPEWKDSDAPDANGRFRDLNPEDLATWLIKTRDKDLTKITGSLNQQIVFNRNEDPEYADKMERTRKEVYKQLGREDLLEKLIDSDGYINCTGCDWKWAIVDGGEDPFKCHKCGCDNTPDIKVNEAEETYNDYPAAASKNAKQAIDWKEEHGRDEVTGGTAVGWARAHQLAKGEKLSRDVVSRMAQFNRHRKNSKVAAEFKDEPWKDKGYIAWLIWGGDEGVDWAIEKMAEIEKSEVKEQFRYVKTFESFINESNAEAQLDATVEHVYKVLDGKVSKAEILETIRPMVDEGFLSFISGLFKNPFIKRKIGKLADELFAVRVEIGKLELEGDPVERYKQELDSAKDGEYSTSSSYSEDDDRGDDIHAKKIEILQRKEEDVVDAMDNLAGDNNTLLEYLKKVKLEVRMKETEMLMKVADSEVRRIMGQIKQKDQRSVRELDRNIKDMIDAEE